jgi:hypothetical protein
MLRFPRNVKVGKTDRYEAEIDPAWLGDEVIASCPVTASNANVSIGAVTIVDGSVFFMITGNIEGMTDLSFDIVTNTGRTDCKHARVGVEDC